MEFYYQFFFILPLPKDGDGERLFFNLLKRQRCITNL